MRVLVVEDDAVSRILLERTLERWGHEVVTAANGEEALAALADGSIRIVITDWMMPRMDGLELCRRIRSDLEPETAAIQGGPKRTTSDGPRVELAADGTVAVQGGAGAAPGAESRGGYHYVILLTVRTDRESTLMGLEAGADDFITKPFQPEELAARIRVGQRILSLESELRERINRLSIAGKTISDAHNRLSADLAAAAAVQRSFLPKTAPRIDPFKFAWRYRPCSTLGGDYLNVFRIDQRHAGIVVLDVSGHGVQSALMSVGLSRELQFTRRDGEPSLLVRPVGDATWANGGQETGEPEPADMRPALPVEVANQLNARYPLDEETGQYFAMFYGLLDCERRELSYVSAGIPGPILCRGRQVTPLEGYGMPIGVREPGLFVERVVNFQPGDSLIVFTDGVIEAFSPDQRQWGEENMRMALAELAGGSLESVLAGVERRVVKWCQPAVPSDDIALVGLQYV